MESPKVERHGTLIVNSGKGRLPRRPFLQANIKYTITHYEVIFAANELLYYYVDRSKHILTFQHILEVSISCCKIQTGLKIKYHHLFFLFFMKQICGDASAWWTLPFWQSVEWWGLVYTF